MSDVGLYVHIPFCDAKCAYCDFVTFTDRPDQVDVYLDALEAEMSVHSGRRLSTLFIGGGTPTALAPERIRRLMGALRRTFDFGSLGEATVEANPESATPDRLRAYLEGGINRVSFGLQSANNALLSRLGRLHDYSRFESAFHAARDLGVRNINVDLMFGLPGQTGADWRATLETVAALEPEHISAYALKVEPGTKFGRDGVRVDGDEEADMYLDASEFLAGRGYVHYEISNFCRPGLESRHNLRYWKNLDTIGLGVSSTGYLAGRRRKNTRQLNTYITGALAGAVPAEEDICLEGDERERETAMLALRLREGLDVGRLRAMNLPVADQFLSLGLATESAGRYALNPRGWLLSNQLFQHFLSD